MSKSGKNQASGTNPKAGTSKKGKPVPKSPSWAPKLKWLDKKGCWRFRPTINGKEKVFYVGLRATGPDDEVAKARAIHEAIQHRKLYEIHREHIAYRAGMGNDLMRLADDVLELYEFFQLPMKMILDAIYVHHGEPDILKNLMLIPELDEQLKAKDTRIEELESMLAAQGRAAVLNANAPLNELMEKFIKATESGLKSSGSSKSHIGSYRTNTKPFIEFLAEYENPPITTTQDLEANWRAVSDYREELIEECNENEFSKAWLKGRLDKARLLCEYLVKQGYLSVLPRGIDRHWSRVGTDDPSPTFLSVKEIRLLWEKADDRMKLIMILFLNCGYRAADLRTLKRNEIDLKKKQILRQRGKKNTAQAHRLWPVTIKLLRAHLKAVSDDRPFYTGYSNTSKSVNQFIDEHIEQNEDPRRTSKSFRCTGTQELERLVLGTAPHLIDQYLAHGDKRLARHYRVEELTGLFNALDKLGNIFNLD